MDDYGLYYPIFFGSMGTTAAMVLTAFGATIGIIYSGVMISSIGVSRPELVMRSLIPIVMASVVSIYGLIVSVIIARDITVELGRYTVEKAFKALAAGFSVGGCGIAAGYAIGASGQAGILAFSKNQKFFVGMILIMIFGEVLGLYGLILGLILAI